MFYFTSEGWKAFTNKITYKETKEIYDNDPHIYTGNSDLSEVEVTPVALTDEQLRRLETIKHIASMGNHDVIKYVLDNVVEDKQLVDLQIEIKAEETRKKLINLIPWDELSTEGMLDFIDDFKGYEVGAFYIAGDIFSVGRQLYKVIQSHTSQADWLPDSTPALYLPMAPPGVIPQWVQPTGAHDTYALGGKVLFEGKTYESLIAANAYSPTAYPAGWKLIS